MALPAPTLGNKTAATVARSGGNVGINFTVLPCDKNGESGWLRRGRGRRAQQGEAAGEFEEVCFHKFIVVRL